MKPYYQDQQATLYHCSAIEVLPELASDLVLTDFPYGIGENYDVYEDTQENLKKLIAQVMGDIVYSSRTALITCGVGNIHKYPTPRWILSWVTPAGAGSGPWGFCCWQPILAYGKDPWLVNNMGRMHDTYVSTEISPDNGHPCPKPISFWKWLLKRGSIKETDIILDPMCGSGTTLVAAKQLGRKAIGIDISKDYLDIAVDRLRQEVIPFDTPVTEEGQEVLF